MRFISRAVFFIIMLFVGTHLSYAKEDTEKKDAKKNNTTKERALNDTSQPSDSGDLIRNTPPNTPPNTPQNTPVETKPINFQKAKKQ